MNNEQTMWPKIDMEFFKQLVELHNEICLREKSNKDFSDFVLQNKEKINNPDYLQIFAERVELFNEDFYKENFEMCKVFFEFMQNNPAWRDLPFGLRTGIRLGVFEDEFAEFLKKNTTTAE